MFTVIFFLLQSAVSDLVVAHDQRPRANRRGEARCGRARTGVVCCSSVLRQTRVVARRDRRRAALEFRRTAGVAGELVCLG